jgi:hypothetical protein
MPGPKGGHPHRLVGPQDRRRPGASATCPIGWKAAGPPPAAPG